MEKLFAKIKKETLNPDEKAKIFSVLRNFVLQNPIQSVRSPFYSEWFVFKQRMFIVPIAFVLVLVLTSSTVFAAKNSLPGDTLYPVKMLKERVESLTATNTKARAEIEVSHAISRLEEVEKIVTSKKQLNEGSGQEIGDNFEIQVQEAVDNINELRNSGETEHASTIWSDFKKSIAEHERTITELSNSTSTKRETKRELEQVVSGVRFQLERSDEDGERGEVKGAETKREAERKQATSTEETRTKREDSSESNNNND